MPDLPERPRRQDRDRRSIRNDSTQVNDIEQGKLRLDAEPAPARPLRGGQGQVRGHPVPGRADDQHLLLLDEHDRGRRSTTSRSARRSTTRSTPRRWNGSTPASSTATQQILPPGMPGYEKFELYPHDMAKAKELIEEANPSRPRHHRLDRQRKPQRRSRRLLRRTCSKKLGFNAKLKIINADNYFTVIGNAIDARPRHRLVGLVRGLPAPERLLPAAAGRAKASCRPTTTTSPTSTTRS